MPILQERRLTLSQAARQLQLHVSTVWRWTLRGVRGVKLETSLVGGQRFTSHEALDRFVARINATDSSASAVGNSHQRQREIEAAERELAESGI